MDFSRYGPGVNPLAAALANYQGPGSVPPGAGGGNAMPTGGMTSPGWSTGPSALGTPPAPQIMPYGLPVGGLPGPVGLPPNVGRAPGPMPALPSAAQVPMQMPPSNALPLSVGAVPSAAQPSYALPAPNSLPGIGMPNASPFGFGGLTR